MLLPCTLTPNFSSLTLSPNTHTFHCHVTFVTEPTGITCNVISAEANTWLLFLDSVRSEGLSFTVLLTTLCNTNSSLSLLRCRRFSSRIMMQTCTHKMLRYDKHAQREPLCSSACLRRCAGCDTDKQKGRRVRGGRGRRADGLVAGLHNPVLQFVGILSLHSKQSRCSLTPTP